MNLEVLTLIRHGETAYNKYKASLKNSSLYQDFLKELSQGTSRNSDTLKIASRLVDENRDFRITEPIPLSDEGQQQARVTASRLKYLIELPDVVYVSPFRRTLDTLDCMGQGWPELNGIPMIQDERLGEQKHGSLLDYGDWKLFCFYRPEQKELRKEQGSYYYRFPNDESIADVQVRTKTLIDDIGEKYSRKRVLIVSHNIAILTIRANIDNLGPEEVVGLNKSNEQINCGVTVYRNGLRRDLDNSKLY